MLATGRVEGDHPQVPEDAKLLRYRGLGLAGELDQLPDTTFAATEGLQELSPRGGRQGLEDAVHG
jgi:hypothetical protein